ncbi:MAG: PTS fructose transporter subunit IIB [Tenericutes bacterium 4572_104]|nr:MAG: PTS fructose transporter subunit IIB [Tenericutes bacterium 4572_104]
MKIVAVTSCPVGMAHTYMAAAALKKMAKKYGYEILVETQGSMGIRNKLSQSDIDSADIFINSADITIIEQERFNNIPTYKTSTSKVIKKAKDVFEEAIAIINK